MQPKGLPDVHCSCFILAMKDFAGYSWVAQQAFNTHPMHAFPEGKPKNIIYSLSRNIFCNPIPNRREAKVKIISIFVKKHEPLCLVADIWRTSRALSLRTIKGQWPQSNRLRLIACSSHFSRNFLLDLKSWKIDRGKYYS